MTESASPAVFTPATLAERALYIDDRELRRRINPKLGWDRFRAAVREAETRGFPRIRALWGGRYWPAVKAWLDDDNGVNLNGFAGDAQDGPEHFDAPAREKTGLQDRPHAAERHAAALLDRPPGGARSDGVPGRLHSVATRR